jgi:tetratricopeptide (TPR) repeat protein
LAAHLDFGEVPPAQAQWLQLLRHNSLPDEAPVSYLVQPEWRKILQQAAESWQTQYHLGLSYFHDAEYDIAAKYIARSLELQRNAYNMLAWANILRVQGKRDEALALYARLVTHEQADVSLVKECFKVFVDQQYDPAKMVALWEKLPSDLQERPVFRFFRAYAFAYSGELEKAEAILRDIGLLMPEALPEPSDEKPEYQSSDIAQTLESSEEFRMLTAQVELRLPGTGRGLTRHGGHGTCTLTRAGLTYRGTKDGETVELSFPLQSIYRLLFGAGKNFEIYNGKEILFFVPEEKRSAVDWYMASMILYDEATQSDT